MQGIAQDIVRMYREEGRRLVSDIVSQQLLDACAEGPRASEQFTAVAAAFTTAVASLADAQDLAAGFLSQLAAKLEKARMKTDRWEGGNQEFEVRFWG
jgi:nucleolar MIF4G domain-containing protein 1